jgi:predicted metal-dependent phosphoesterase TrpH
MHSSCSDGTDAPAALASKVVAAGLHAAALTDHDTTVGHAEFKAVLADHGVEFVPGVEISCRRASTGQSVHVLCYFVDDGVDSPLQRVLEGLRSDRATRNARMLERLEELGYAELSAERIEELAGKPFADAGRPHFAQALLESYGPGEEPSGFASTDEVFAQLLGNDRPGYVPKAHLSIAEAAAAAAASGAVAVIAHPMLTFMRGEGAAISPAAQRQQLSEIFAELAADGVVGVECHHSRHRPEEIAVLVELCERFDLVPTGGSDYHGALKPDLSVGIGVEANRGTAKELRIPDSTLDALRSRRR